ncbi:auxin-responsive protein SAUR78 [Andrographis paniculata]|uniref:auxin-responsive protein SAUR78 n=1 Tax=Andrographis paniculata TaxID=175694 RepID=UPI0021E8552A|nr:auxin-responsive protein SAUR78 [Andrographis paniculata]
MKKKMESILRRCKTLSRQLRRTSSSSYSTFIRSMSMSSTSHSHYTELSSCRSPEKIPPPPDDDSSNETVLVGSSRRRYVLTSKHLTHPLLNALIRKSKTNTHDSDSDLSVKCEVVLFDHLLWMLDNTDPSLGSDSLEELAELYVY